MNTINKNIENNKETKEKSEDNIVNNNIELIKIKPLKKKIINNKETNNKKIPSWIDNTYKSKKLLNYNKDFKNINEIKNNDENINLYYIKY